MKGEEANVQTYYWALDVEIIFNAKQIKGGIGSVSWGIRPVGQYTSTLLHIIMQLAYIFGRLMYER